MRARLAAGFFCGVLGACAWPQSARGDTPTTRPAATQATTQPSEKSHVVKRGTLSLEIQADGALAAVDPHEVKLKLRSYAGPLEVVSAATHGATVTNGDALLELDAREITWAIEAAEAAVASARANLKKAESDVELGQKGDALALRISEQNLKNANDSLKWFESVDGPNMLLSAELAARQTKYSVEDQDDELDQLRKMYKTEDLTTATADIVIKRALRRLEVTRENLRMAEGSREKVTQHAHPVTKQRMSNAVEQAQQELAMLKATQEQSRVTRASALTTARVAAAQAQEKLDDHKHDLAMFKWLAPADGTVVYAQLPDALPGGENRTLEPGDKVSAGGMVMRLVASGKYRVDLPLQEAEAFVVEKGMRATVTPLATPWKSFEATCGQVVGGVKGQEGFKFTVPVTLTEADPRLLPGMKASVRIHGGKIEGALTVPVAMVKDGAVYVEGDDGKVERRNVELGKSDGKMIEVRSGLVEGDRVVEEAAR
jgi:RND family efflux transporter MFP subunit